MNFWIVLLTVGIPYLGFMAALVTKTPTLFEAVLTPISYCRRLLWPLFFGFLYGATLVESNIRNSIKWADLDHYQAIDEAFPLSMKVLAAVVVLWVGLYFSEMAHPILNPPNIEKQTD